MRAFVIGGTRFIGPPIVRALVTSGADVAVFHRGESPAQAGLGAAEYLGDRNDLHALRDALTAFAPTVVVDVCSFYESHQEILEQALEGLSGQLILISSCDVYRNFGGLIGVESGDPDPVPLPETSPVRSTLYPYKERPRPTIDTVRYDKIPIERRVISDGGNVLRLPMVYGPADRQHRTFDYVRRMQDRRKAILVPQSHEKWQSCRAFVDNVGAAVLAVARSPVHGEVFNICDRPTLTEFEWIEAIGRTMNWQGRVVVVDDDKLPEALKPGADYRWSIATKDQKLRETTGYKEAVDFESGLARTVVWQRENAPDGAARPDYELEDRVLVGQ